MERVDVVGSRFEEFSLGVGFEFGESERITVRIEGEYVGWLPRLIDPSCPVPCIVQTTYAPFSIARA